VRKEASSAVRKVGGRQKKDEGEMEKNYEKRGKSRKKKKKKGRRQGGTTIHPPQMAGYTTSGSRPH
jgi:hypothetical protein